VAFRKDIIKSYTSRGERYFRVVFQFRGYRVRLRGFATYAEAMQVASDIRVKILAGSYDPDTYGKSKADELTFSQMWFRHYKPHAERTLKNSTFYVRTKAVEKKLLPKLGNKRLSTISTPVIERCWAKCRDEGDSEAYVGTHWIALRAVLRHAVKLGYLESIPNAKKPRYTRGVKRILSIEEVAKMYRWGMTSDDIEEEVLNLFAFIFMTACRIGEAQALTLDDINLEGGYLSINKRLYMGVVDSTKTDTDLRIPIHNQLRPVLESQLKLNEGLDKGDTKLVFRSRYSGKAISKYLFWKRIKLIARETIGDDVEVSAHTLRRSLASAMVSAAIPVDEAASMLRNSPQVLLKHYNKADTVQFKESFNGLDLMRAETVEIETV